MRNINNTFTTEKNKEENSPIHLYLIENYDGNSNDLRYTDWPTNVTYKGQTWISFPISHTNISENASGEIDSLKIIVSNISRLIQSYLESYDFRKLKVEIYTVFSNHLDDSDAYMLDIYYVDNYVVTENDVEFFLTSKFDVLDLELPSRKYSRNHCGWKFKSLDCGYTGDETTCNKTLARCRVLGNSTRFGGFPSIPSRRIFIS